MIWAKFTSKRQDKGGGTYAETSGGFFTSLRKRLAFAIASSRLVAAAATQREEATAKANRFRKEVKKPPLVSA